MAGAVAIPDGKFGDYRVLQALAPTTFCCLDAASRKVVLKQVEPDCLLRGNLHPSIKDRLARVRELAQKQVATLHTVERIGDGVWLVWDYVEGETLADHMASPRSISRLSWLAREVILCIESLHMRGIVHGSLHARNIVITTTGEIRLTHVSPLLYNDPMNDVAAVVGILREMGHQPGDCMLPLANLACEAEAGQFGLRDLGSRLTNLVDGSMAPAHSDQGESDTRVRASAIAAAVLVTVLGIAGGVIIHRASARPANPSRDFGRLDQFPATR